MSMGGFITTKDVFRHSRIILREFGASAYLRCCIAVIRRRRTTFLDCVLTGRPQA